jgi:hypothetical protein
MLGSSWGFKPELQLMQKKKKKHREREKKEKLLPEEW